MSFLGEALVGVTAIKIGGAPVGGLKFPSRERAEGIAPSRPAGLYDLEIEFGNGLEVLYEDRIEYVEAFLPPLTDLRATYVDTEVNLSWGVPQLFDEIVVWHGRTEVARLAGSASHFTMQGLSDEDPSTDFTLFGVRDGIESYQARVVAVRNECSPQLVDIGSGRPSRTHIPLRGTGEPVWTTFTLTERADEGLRVEALAQAHQLFSLYARITPVDDPSTTLINGINLGGGSLRHNPSGGWLRGTTDEPLDPGRYRVEFFVENSGTEPYYSFVADDSEFDPGPPHPCPPFPLVRVYAESSGGPQFFGLQERVVHPAAYQDYLTPFPTNADDSLNLATTVVLETAWEEGFFFEWNFGDGTTTTTASKRVVHTFPQLGRYKLSVTATDEECRQTTVELDYVLKAPSVGRPLAGSPPRLSKFRPRNPERLSFISGGGDVP
ncbi:MAG: PKD domain-containing protein, partial [Planctomycetota bacterium]